MTKCLVLCCLLTAITAASARATESGSPEIAAYLVTAGLAGDDAIAPPAEAAADLSKTCEGVSFSRSIKYGESDLNVLDVASGDLGETSPRPVLVKISPDLERKELFEICETALEIGVDGIVACNTTVAREALGVSSPHPGGLSGRPLLIRARELIRDIHTHTRGKIPIIGVGGVATAEDAWLHIRAGASLVELYTALIYEGPGVVERITLGLADLLRRGGFRSIGEAVGIDR